MRVWQPVVRAGATGRADNAVHLIVRSTAAGGSPPGLAWTRLLGLHDQPDLAHAEPETLHYRLLHLPATLSSHARQRILKIRRILALDRRVHPLLAAPYPHPPDQETVSASQSGPFPGIGDGDPAYRRDRRRTHPTP